MSAQADDAAGSYLAERITANELLRTLPAGARKLVCNWQNVLGIPIGLSRGVRVEGRTRNILLQNSRHGAYLPYSKPTEPLPYTLQFNARKLSLTEEGYRLLKPTVICHRILLFFWNL